MSSLVVLKQNTAMAFVGKNNKRGGAGGARVNQGTDGLLGNPLGLSTINVMAIGTGSTSGANTPASGSLDSNHSNHNNRSSSSSNNMRLRRSPRKTKGVAPIPYGMVSYAVPRTQHGGVTGPATAGAVTAATTMTSTTSGTGVTGASGGGVATRGVAFRALRTSDMSYTMGGYAVPADSPTAVLPAHSQLLGPPPVSLPPAPPTVPGPSYVSLKSYAANAHANVNPSGGLPPTTTAAGATGACNVHGGHVRGTGGLVTTAVNATGPRGPTGSSGGGGGGGGWRATGRHIDISSLPGAATSSALRNEQLAGMVLRAGGGAGQGSLTPPGLRSPCASPAPGLAPSGGVTPRTHATANFLTSLREWPMTRGRSRSHSEGSPRALAAARVSGNSLLDGGGRSKRRGKGRGKGSGPGVGGDGRVVAAMYRERWGREGNSNGGEGEGEEDDDVNDHDDDDDDDNQRERDDDGGSSSPASTNSSSSSPSSTTSSPSRAKEKRKGKGRGREKGSKGRASSGYKPKGKRSSLGSGSGTNDGKVTSGRWTAEEHNVFLKGLRQHGKEWKKISEMIKTRTVVQTRTHAQKYFQKLSKLDKAKTGKVNASFLSIARPKDPVQAKIEAEMVKARHKGMTAEHMVRERERERERERRGEERERERERER